MFANTTVLGRHEQPYDKQIWVHFHDLNWPDMILRARTGREPDQAVQLGTDALYCYQLEYPRWGVNVIEFEPSRAHRLGGIRCIGGDIVNIAAGHRSERLWLVMVLKHSEQEDCRVEVWMERMSTALGRESSRRRENPWQWEGNSMIGVGQGLFGGQGGGWGGGGGGWGGGGGGWGGGGGGGGGGGADGEGVGEDGVVAGKEEDGGGEGEDGEGEGKGGEGEGGVVEQAVAVAMAVVMDASGRVQKRRTRC